MALAHIKDGQRILRRKLLHPETGHVGVVEFVEGSEMELSLGLESVSGETVHGGYALILATDHIVPANVHTLVCEAGLTAVFPLKGPEKLYFSLVSGAGGQGQQCRKNKKTLDNHFFKGFKLNKLLQSLPGALEGNHNIAFAAPHLRREPALEAKF